MNTIIEFIIDHWLELICAYTVIFMFVVFCKNFLSLPKGEQFKQIKGWLLGAVTLAESQYGGGTGKIKLSVVYDKFVEKFPWIAKILTFEKFGEYVDDALVEMRRLLESNTAVAAIVESKNDSAENKTPAKEA